MKSVSAALMATVLAGCSTVSSLDVMVSSQGQWPVQRKPATYAFERLPSQQGDLATQELAEAAARPALEQLGFKPAAPAEAEVLVQVGTRSVESWRRDPFWGPWSGGAYWSSGRRGPWGPGWGSGWGPGWGGGFATGPSDWPEFMIEVGVLIREPDASVPLYETRARLISRTSNSSFFMPMFDAALRDFPGPALSPRTVSVGIAPRAR